MKYDVIVIGAGIVGLASAYRILEAKPSLKLLILEKENDVAKHQTGNNSGVIHSGIIISPAALRQKIAWKAIGKCLISVMRMKLSMSFAVK